MSFSSKLGDFAQGLASGLGPGIKLGTDISAARSRTRRLEEKEKAALQSKTRTEQEKRLERMFKDGAHDAAIEGAIAVGRPDLAEEYRTRRTAQEGLKTDKGIATLGKAAAEGDPDKTAAALDVFKLDEGLGTGVTGTDTLPELDVSPEAERARGLRGPYSMDTPSGSATVMMQSIEEDGRFYATPTLFPKKEKPSKDPADWTQLSGSEALRIARERDELFEFDTAAEAESFARGGWKPARVPGVWEPAPGTGGTQPIDRPAAEAIFTAEQQYEHQLGERQRSAADKVADDIAREFLKNPGEHVSIGDPASFSTYHRMFERHMAQSGLGKKLTREQQEGLFATTKRQIRGLLVKRLFADNDITADEAKRYETTMEAWGVDPSAWEGHLNLMVTASEDASTTKFMKLLGQNKLIEAQAFIDHDPTLSDSKKAVLQEAIKKKQLGRQNKLVDGERTKIMKSYAGRRFPFYIPAHELNVQTAGTSAGEALMPTQKMDRESDGKRVMVLNTNYSDPFLKESFDFSKNEDVNDYTEKMAILNAGGSPELVRAIFDTGGVPVQDAGAEAPPSIGPDSYKKNLIALADKAKSMGQTIESLSQQFGSPLTPDSVMSEVLNIVGGNAHDAQVFIEELKEHPMLEAFLFGQQAPQAPIPFLPQQ